MILDTQGPTWCLQQKYDGVSDSALAQHGLCLNYALDKHHGQSLVSLSPVCTRYKSLCLVQ